MAAMDKLFFYGRLRGGLFGPRLQQGQVDSIEAILDCWEATMANGDLRWLAYILATAYHETARTMQPVRETLADSDAQAVARLERAWRGGRLPTVSTPYWRRDAAGLSYYGRGLVQITHRRNYERMGRVIGVDLAAEPDLALRLDLAATILVVGMTEGLFSGARLADFFSGAKADWTGARKIVNGSDRALEVADYGKAFCAAMRYEAAVGGRVANSE